MGFGVKDMLAQHGAQHGAQQGAQHVAQHVAHHVIKMAVAALRKNISAAQVSAAGGNRIVSVIREGRSEIDGQPNPLTDQPPTRSRTMLALLPRSP